MLRIILPHLIPTLGDSSDDEKAQALMFAFSERH